MEPQVLVAALEALIRSGAFASLAPARWTLRVEQIVASWRKPWRGDFILRAADGTHVNVAWRVTPHVEARFAVAVAAPA